MIIIYYIINITLLKPLYYISESAQHFLMNDIIAVSVWLNIYNNIYYIKLTSNGIIYEHLQKLNYVNW